MANRKVNSREQLRKTSTRSSQLSAETSWVPNTNVYIAERIALITVEVAGMKKEDLQLAADGNRLRIAGHREDVGRTVKGTFQQMEIRYGTFESIVELPEGYDLTQARAAYDNGFLRVEVPALIRPPKRPVTVPLMD